MRTLQITSPMMSGKDVRSAQAHLRRNVFKTDFMQGAKTDGQFGPETGRACKRAKFWLGYLLPEMVATYGLTLDNFLTGEVKLPDRNVRLRQGRLKQKAQTPLREKAFKQAEADVGMKESPANSNRCPISNHWGIQGPWCAMAVSTWYLRAGSKAFKDHVDWAYVPWLLAAAAEGRDGVALTRDPKRGDICTFDWEPDRISDHVGLFDHWIAKGKTFKTIEGNTSVGNNSNGGQVMRRERSVGQVAKTRSGIPGFIHVGK